MGSTLASPEPARGASLAVVWLATLVAAVHAMAVRRDVAAHRFWMTLNVSLAFAAVILRVYVGVLLALGNVTPTVTSHLRHRTHGWMLDAVAARCEASRPRSARARTAAPSLGVARWGSPYRKAPP